MPAYVQAKAIRQGMLAAEPTNRSNRAALASCETKEAAALLTLGRPAESRACCERALALREDLVKADPGNEDFSRGLAETLLRSGSAKAIAGDGRRRRRRLATGRRGSIPPTRRSRASRRSFGPAATAHWRGSPVYQDRGSPRQRRRLRLNRR